MRYPGLLLVLFIIACRPPWLAQDGKLESFQYQQDDIYNLLRNYHDHLHPDDKLVIVYQSKILKKQKNNLVTFEDWTIGTTRGRKIDYIIQTAYYLDHRPSEGPTRLGSSGRAGYLVMGISSPELLRSLNLVAHEMDQDFTHMSVLLRPEDPEYPPEAKAARVQGTVVVEMVIGPDGIPRSTKALSGPQELRGASEGYCLRWKFNPAKLNGVPQFVRFKMSVPWHLN